MKNFVLKQLLLVFISSLAISFVKANQYLQIRFRSNELIAASVTVGGYHLITFHDPLLTGIFAENQIKFYGKSYPAAARFTGPLADTLLRVYTIATMDNV